MAMTHEAMFPMDAFKGFVICWDVTDGNFLVQFCFISLMVNWLIPILWGSSRKTPNWGSENVNS